MNYSLKNKKIDLNIALACMAGIAIISFYGGIAYGKNKQNQSPFTQGGAGFGQMNTPNGRFSNSGQQNGQQVRMGNRGGFASGEVLNKDDKSVTLKLANGGSQIVFYSTSTLITKSTTGTIDDLVIGKQVTVIGPTNQDGSVNAQSIQLHPEGLQQQGNPTESPKNRYQ